MNFSIIGALVVSASLCLMPLDANAEDEYNVSPGITSEGVPLGMRGVDPYAFITLENRITGQAAHVASHDGVSYYFANASNREKFLADPEAYMPQFGGFCAYAVAAGKKFDGDPTYADIVDGKLYLFVNDGAFTLYQKDKAGTLQRAHAKWPEIKSKAVETL